jgi:tripartite-type tricarboxylate transporter receptor subunit TctC
MIEAATAELSSVLFSMPKVGGGVPDAFTRLVPVNLVEEEEDEVVVVVSGGGGGGAGGGGRAGGAAAAGNEVVV